MDAFGNDLPVEANFLKIYEPLIIDEIWEVGIHLWFLAQ